jgi:hypothetical protein
MRGRRNPPTWPRLLLATSLTIAAVGPLQPYTGFGIPPAAPGSDLVPMRADADGVWDAGGGRPTSPPARVERGPVPLPPDPSGAAAVRSGVATGPLGPRRLALLALEPLEAPRVHAAGVPALSLEDGAGLPEPAVDVRAEAPGLDAVPRSPTQAPPSAPPGRQFQPANLQFSGVLMFKYIRAPVAPVAGGANLNDITPTPAQPEINDEILEMAMMWTISPTFRVFGDFSLEARNGDLGASDIEEFYVEAHDLFGLQGSGIRAGRDRIKLGFVGLLLDETVFDGGRRNGIEIRLPRLGPVAMFGFVQDAVDEPLFGQIMSTRRVWGARAQAEVIPGWTVNVSYRADTAGDVDVGTCPGIGCNVGTGLSGGIEGSIVPGMDLLMEAATYTQSGDVARWYYEGSLVFDLQRLLGVQIFQPVVTLWYKNFDPYTLPLDAPLGHLLTPDDFRLFNTNDNLTAVGGRVDLAVTPAVSVFALAEWGTYKDGGPNYNVYSFGVQYTLSPSTLIKLTWNGYSVDGGVVTTSPVTGLQLSNAQVYQVEFTRSF